MRVLDIAGGWGGLAYYMAKNYHVSVVGVNHFCRTAKNGPAAV
nr:cyclopropane-fatty-acyl-phospholipid synthase [Raoultella sp. NCTC 9187]